ncbi:thioredoxin domain-containing protein [Dyadobacter frigoris]|uniref:Redoxin domain-containing protein n=1 Tax=Dyadobacter frigoris TaxID=2576211 RepID=A0A4U6D0J6_9BACT|nr:thioredoxin domain-containing protein [Dyadobacter frigoris]TKT89631.1 redoxin domain-containing protein [Dyadobacter frigoris]GLU54152.1 thioredoxin [Dyadobacter frigoris]
MKSILISFLGILLTTSAVLAQTQLTTNDFQNKLNATKQAQLLDVRTPEEYSQGHLEKAENIDYRNAAFKDQVEKLDKNKPVFVYCLSGGRSGQAAKILHEKGFTDVYDMQGGYLKWTSSGKLIDAPKDAAASNKGMSAPDFKKLTRSGKLVMVDFYAPWCAPCIKMLPTVHKLAEEYKSKATIEAIHYDQNKALAKELGIDEIPAFLFYKNGKLILRKNGLMEEADFKKLIEENL